MESCLCSESPATWLLVVPDNQHMRSKQVNIIPQNRGLSRDTPITLYNDHRLCSQVSWVSLAAVYQQQVDTKKSQNALDKHPTMQHFVTEMSTHVYISITKCCIVRYGTGTLWDLYNRHTLITLCCCDLLLNEWSIDWFYHIDGLAQDCSSSIANALELQQYCTKPPTCPAVIIHWQWCQSRDTQISVNRTNGLCMGAARDLY